MRVAELVAPRSFRIAERSTSDPAAGEVQVAVHAVGICGSDLHAYAEGSVGDSPCRYPVVLGHEPAGVVLRAGPGVTGWAQGDRVALEPAIYCYHCALCRGGRHNLCERLRFLSANDEPGFFREVVNLPAENLLAVPGTVSLDEATLVEPLAVALHSLALAQPRLGETAAVFGAGPIGLLTVAALKWAGVARVWAIEPVPARRALARQMGADAAIDPAAADPTAEILSDTGKRGVDLAIDCATKAGTVNQSLAVARRGGRVVVTGIASERQVPIDVHLWRRKEVPLLPVRRSSGEGPLARDLLARHTALLGAIVTHRQPLERIGQAFATVEGYEDGVGKMLVTVAR